MVAILNLEKASAQRTKKKSFQKNSSGEITRDIELIADNNPDNSYSVNFHLQLIESFGKSDPCIVNRSRVADIKQRIAKAQSEVTKITNLIAKTDINNIQEQYRLTQLLIKAKKNLDNAQKELPQAETKLAECKLNNPGW